MALYSKNDKKRYHTQKYDKFYDLGYKEPRDDYRRDYCRIIHSPAFRRLQGKSQLFPIGESDFFRNRLTHSLEVAQIGKGIASYLNNKIKPSKNKINIEIVEMAGLIHDLGHPPFGHQGEKALDDCMAKCGGFEGNAQTLRILTKIEKKDKDEKSDDFGITEKGKDLRYGLNLTYRSLASILKYDNMIRNRNKQLTEEQFLSDLKIITKKEIEKKYEKSLIDTKKEKLIEDDLKKLSDIIDFEEDIKNTLIEKNIINDNAYPCESFKENLENIKIPDSLKEYSSRIIETLKRWYNRVKLQKGYYKTEKEFVEKIKENVIGDKDFKKFKTIECQIMDIADDIAYSTYDLEDALKGEFISLFDCIFPKKEVREYISKKLNENQSLKRKDYLEKDVIGIFRRIFTEPLNLDAFKESYTIESKNPEILELFINFNEHSKKFIKNGYYRIRLTSSLVAKFVGGIEIEDEINEHPQLMKLKIENGIREEIEVLKHFTYKSLISSNLLKIPEYRGYEIVKTIFDVLQKPDGYLLLPDDYKEIYLKLGSKKESKRIICDFIAGMTDRYVLEFYGRLKSESPQSIFKPI